MKSKNFCICTILFALGLLFAAAIQAQDGPPAPEPVADPSIQSLGDVEEAKAKTRMTAVKFHLRLKILKEKRKLSWKRDKELISKYEALLESPEMLEYIVEKSAKDFETVESKHFEARGPPTASEFGDGVLLEKILEWIENGGLEKILEFIIGIIGAIADNSTIQQNYQPVSIPWAVYRLAA